MTTVKYVVRRLFDVLRKVRSIFTKILIPAGGYYLFGTSEKKTNPISKIYGYDRGKPVDRYYIEQFIKENKDVIKGVCLEITDNDYTVKYGGNKVVKSDALDIDTNNIHATIHGDLRSIPAIKDNTYDTLIVTQTFVMIDDFNSAVKECYRILKPGGILLTTMPCIGRVGIDLNQYWRFTKASGNYVFGTIFGKENVETKTYGNVLSGQCFWVGMASEELTKEQLDYVDPEYPVIVAVKGVKRK